MSDMVGGGAARRGGHDPLAVAVGNGSLLGVGYLLIGRRGLALGTGLVTVVLLAFLAASGSSAVEVVVLVWWVALVGHGWWTGRRTSVRHSGARWIGLVPTVVVLLAVASLRVNAASVAASLDEARARGDCPGAVLAQQRSWLGSRLADAPAATDADDTLEACRRLQDARDRLSVALSPNIRQLGTAYSEIRWVLRSLPGHERMVEVALDDFIARLPAQDGSAATEIIEWIGAQPVLDDPLRRLADTATELAPTALVSCGDSLRSRADFTGATDRYQEVLARFPATAQSEHARQGLIAAAAGQQDGDTRRDTRRRLDLYCDAPFAYPPAPAVAPGINRAKFFDYYYYYYYYYYYFYAPGSFADWEIDDITQAALVVCFDGRQRGSAAQTCSYVSGARTHSVTFYRAAFPVRVYELRTGRTLLDSRPEVGDPTCPDELTSRRSSPTGGPPDQDVEVSDSDIVAVLREVLGPVIMR
jgi:hypothetical protein